MHNSQIHYRNALTDAQTQVCHRVCLSQHLMKSTMKITGEKESLLPNIGFAK